MHISTILKKKSASTIKSRQTKAVLRMGLAVFACLMMAATISVVSPTPAHASGVTSTIVNFDSAGNQVTRYDTQGNAVDAHDGMIALFGSTYYLYGTSYDCGYSLQTNGTTFCGFKVYTSTDLVHWTDGGFLFDATTSTWQTRCAPPEYGCYRPHVIYNASTGNYVLWINSYDNDSGYHAFTSNSPAGPFTEVAEPTLAKQGTSSGFNNGDFGLFVDGKGTAYIVYTNITAGHALYVEQLNANYTSGTGKYVSVGQAGVEAPDLFAYNGTYYLDYGNTCAYCGGTNTAYRTATSPLGIWSAATTISSNSCGGQSSFVTPIPTTSGTMYLYGSDLWNGGANNEALANYFWGPLSFNSNGSIQSLACVDSFQVSLSTGQAGSQQPIPGLDQSDGVSNFRTWCDVASTWSRLQTFTPSASGTLSSVALTTFQKGFPNAALNIDVVSVNTQGQPTGTLSANSIPASSIGWSERNVIVSPNIAVTAGQQYGILLHSTTTQGCYGMAFNDGGLYSAGQELYSSNGGGSFTEETNRALKFFTALNAPTSDYALGATPSASSSVEGYGWSLADVNDGQTASTPSSMGWSSANNTGSNHTEWVQLDLGTSVSLDEVDLFPRTDTSNVGQGFPVDFTIAISNDGTNWTTVVSQTGYPLPSSGAVQSFTFVAQTARYMRVQGTTLRLIPNDNNAYRMQFAEIALY